MEVGRPHLTRAHARRLREVYRSAGWPSLDAIEIDLLAAGLLERVENAKGLESVRVTDAGLQYLAQTLHGNRQAFSKHEALVNRVATDLLRHGRLVWTTLSLRAWLAPDADEEGARGRWKMCKPDVFSIRNSSVEAYLEPVVHEIKVSRADLLGDLKRAEKRQAYLDLGGQCWYVLGCDVKGRPIADADEIPLECGVMVYTAEANRLEVMRNAPKRPAAKLPFPVWMALAKAAPLASPDGETQGQGGLQDC